jgi:hypothetical protein
MSILSRFFKGSDDGGDAAEPSDEPTQVTANQLAPEAQQSVPIDATPPAPPEAARNQAPPPPLPKRAPLPSPVKKGAAVQVGRAQPVGPPAAEPAKPRETQKSREPTQPMRPAAKAAQQPPQQKAQVSMRAVPPATRAPAQPARSAPPVDSMASSLQDSLEQELEDNFRTAVSGSVSGSISGSVSGSAASHTQNTAVSAPPKPPEPTLTDSDREALRKMFDEIAATHLRPIRDVVLEVRYGTAPSSWLRPCRAAVKQLVQAAEQLERSDLSPKLLALDGALADAESASNGSVEGQARETLLGAYDALVPIAPALLSLESEHGRREPVLVRSLLLQIEGVEAVTIEKLWAAGLGELRTLTQAKPEEISVVCGIEADVAGAIAARLSRFVRELGGTLSTADSNAERARLRALVDSLRSRNEEFEKAAEKWSESSIAQKRRLRVERARVLHEIVVTLARLGEVERIAVLDRLPYARKINELNQYVTSPLA